MYQQSGDPGSGALRVSQPLRERLPSLTRQRNFCLRERSTDASIGFSPGSRCEGCARTEIAQFQTSEQASAGIPKRGRRQEVQAERPTGGIRYCSHLLTQRGQANRIGDGPPLAGCIAGKDPIFQRMPVPGVCQGPKGQ